MNELTDASADRLERHLDEAARIEARAAEARRAELERLEALTGTPICYVRYLITINQDGCHPAVASRYPKDVPDA